MPKGMACRVTYSEGIQSPYRSKNLRYFYKAQLLSERQMRWTDLLSPFNFTLEYRPDKNADQPDALSHHEQDMPAGIHDERLNF